MTTLYDGLSGHERKRVAPPLPKGLKLDRRRFLKGSFAMIGAYAAAAGGATWLVAPDKSWALEFDTFEPDIARSLLAMTRTLYPHEFLGDVHYAKVVKDLDAQAAGGFQDKAFLDLMREGVRAMDEKAGGDFAGASPESREEVLKSISGSNPEFFQAVRGKQVVSLYNQPEVWEQFGYEGPSYPTGGYLYNGFDDISWLPDPPPEASPPVKALEDALDALPEEYIGPVGAEPLQKAELGGN